jgi:hypothetical protein
MIKYVTTPDNDIWNDFLEKEKDNQIVTIAHNPSLGPILAKTFGYKSQNLAIMKEDKIVGVLPAVLFRNKIVSIPHFSYGGPIIDAKAEIDVDLNALFKGRKFEVRSLTKISKYFTDTKNTFVVELDKTVDEHFQSFASKFRNKIKKSMKVGFRVAQGGQELLNDFYTLYSRRMFQKGSPPLGKVFFQNLIDGYAFGDVEITVVYDDLKPIAVGFSLSYLDFNEICWASTDLNYNKQNVNSFLYWNVLRSSITKNFRYFSMGRSTVNSNNHHYKKQWAPLELPIYYNYSEPVGKSVKELTFLTKLWKFQPLRSSVYIGHIISKYVY